MNVTELIARVRRNAFIRDNHPDYTDQIIIDELNDALRAIYLDIVTLPRQGHWLKQYTFTSTAGMAQRPLTGRAVVGGVEKIEIADSGSGYWPLTGIDEVTAGLHESVPGLPSGTPQYYVMRGSTIFFMPAFDRAMTVRVSYYLKPSLLVSPQSSPTQGMVTTIDPVTRELLIQGGNVVIRTDQQAGVSVGTVLASSAGLYAVDVIRPSGTFEVVMPGPLPLDRDPPNPNPTISASGITFTFPVGTDVTVARRGDQIRGAGETEWPPFAEEFHRTVADIASVKIMLQLNMSAKARDIASSVSGDLARMRTMYSVARGRMSPKRVGLSMITMGAARRNWPRFP